METFTLASSKTIKNMAKDNSIGSLYLLPSNKVPNLLNFMKEDGGVVYLMVMAAIKNLMVIIMMGLSKMA